MAGTRITFARYTGETPDKVGDGLRRLDHPRPYTEKELRDDEEGIASRGTPPEAPLRAAGRKAASFPSPGGGKT